MIVLPTGRLFREYRISTSGLVMECDRIASVRNWPTPSTVKEVQRFQLLPEVYPGFWTGGCSHYVTAEEGASASWMVGLGGQGFWSPEGSFNLGTRAGTSRPLFGIHSGGGRIGGWGWSRALPALGYDTKAPPLCFLFSEAQPGGAKL